MMQITLNPGELFKRLEEIEDSLDVERIADAAAAAQLNRLRQRFLAQVDTNETPWVPSRAAARRQASGRGGGTLFDTGTLFHSIGVKRVGVGVRSIGTDVSYARKHQEGLEGELKREFIGISSTDAETMTKTTMLLINRALRRRR